jgi:hypothetical protein
MEINKSGLNAQAHRDICKQKIYQKDKKKRNNLVTIF